MLMPTDHLDTPLGGMSFPNSQVSPGIPRRGDPFLMRYPVSGPLIGPGVDHSQGPTAVANFTPLIKKQPLAIFLVTMRLGALGPI